MSDLSVTDVQAALRHFANNTGHNILTDDPHNILIDNKKYGMAVGHHLSIHTRKEGDDVSLKSFIHQTESPIVSELETFYSTTGSRWVRKAAPIGPHRDATGNHPSETYSTEGVQHPDGPVEGMLHQVNGSGGFATPIAHRLWVPHEDLHAALKAHTGGLQPKLSQEELKGFNHPLALERRVSANSSDHEANPTNTIYKGLVHVSHVTTDAFHRTNYLYDPQTEAMHKYRSIY